MVFSTLLREPNHDLRWLRMVIPAATVNLAVSTSLICLGSVFEYFSKPIGSRNPSTSISFYQKAISALQNEINELEYGLLPAFMASIVLAASEALFRRMPAALIHLQGAFRILGLASEVSKHSLNTKCIEGNEDINDIALNMDMHTAWYRLSQPPDLPLNFGLSGNLTKRRDIINERRLFASLLHDCYHFACKAATFKYRPFTSIPSSILAEQQTLVASLDRCLALLNIDNTADNEAHKAESLIQKCQCLSTFIYLSTILQPYEKAYDAFEIKFCQIIETAQFIIDNYYQNHSSLPFFRFRPGIFQPLYFTAMKYRNSYQRRRAVELIRRIGFEGPWNAQLMAAIATRAINIEEASNVPDVPNLSVHQISECTRVHGSGHVSPAVENIQSSIFAEAEFSICTDVKGMIAAADELEQRQFWNIWTEQVQIPDYV
ncbi:hypothetical protein LTR05_002048 [Lithohypha guttulata]|uniref:Uncharacterized protein n=1 Tax=Lithohypha guttulata TaxID=1690604 RepID=A0AAN7T3K7_9EURO|nr:hypothetical protein LTR05_002048 [Lithohypha guttulata]